MALKNDIRVTIYGQNGKNIGTGLYAFQCPEAAQFARNHVINYLSTFLWNPDLKRELRDDDELARHLNTFE